MSMILHSFIAFVVLVQNDMMYHFVLCPEQGKRLKEKTQQLRDGFNLSSSFLYVLACLLVVGIQEAIRFVFISWSTSWIMLSLVFTVFNILKQFAKNIQVDNLGVLFFSEFVREGVYNFLALYHHELYLNMFIKIVLVNLSVFLL